MSIAKTLVVLLLLAVAAAHAASVGGRHAEPDAGEPPVDEHGEGVHTGLPEDELHGYDLGRDGTMDPPVHTGTDQDCVGGQCEVLSAFQKEYAGVLKGETYEPSVLMVGIVTDSPRTLAVWNAVRDLAREQGVAMEYIAYSSYERLVMAAFHGHFQLGWFSPLAVVEVRRMAKSYGFNPKVVASAAGEEGWERSVCVAPAGSALRALADLKGRTVAVGAADSPRSAMLPLVHLAKESGLALGQDVTVKRHDLGLGLHGESPGLDDQRAAAAAVEAGEADAACFGESDLKTLQEEGLLAGASVLTATPKSAGFAMAVLDGHEQAVASLVREFEQAVLNVSAEAAATPAGKRFFEVMGGSNFAAPSEDGYDALDAAVGELHYLNAWLESLGASGDLSHMPHGVDGEQGFEPFGDVDGGGDGGAYTFGDMNFDDMTEEERQAFFGGIPDHEEDGDTPHVEVNMQDE